MQENGELDTLQKLYRSFALPTVQNEAEVDKKRKIEYLELIKSFRKPFAEESKQALCESCTVDKNNDNNGTDANVDARHYSEYEINQDSDIETSSTDEKDENNCLKRVIFF
jgi:hypothetical protein